MAKKTKNSVSVKKQQLWECYFYAHVSSFSITKTLFVLHNMSLITCSLPAAVSLPSYLPFLPPFLPPSLLPSYLPSIPSI